VLPVIVGFDIYLKDCWYWPADVLEDVVSVVSVDVCPFSTGKPALEKRLSMRWHICHSLAQHTIPIWSVSNNTFMPKFHTCVHSA